MPTQLPRVPSLIPSSLATLAIGRDVSITIFTASSLNSGEKLFFGRGKFLPFQIAHPNGWTVRKARGTSPGAWLPIRRPSSDPYTRWRANATRKTRTLGDWARYTLMLRAGQGTEFRASGRRADRVAPGPSVPG